MPQTPKERHNRSQQAYRQTVEGKGKQNTWDRSIAGRQSRRLRNQRYQAKLRAINNQTREDEQRIRDSEIRDKDGKLIGHIIDGVIIPLPMGE